MDMKTEFGFTNGISALMSVIWAARESGSVFMAVPSPEC